MYRILISDSLGQAGLDLLDAAPDTSYDLHTRLDRAALMELIPEYDALIVRSSTQVDADLLSAGTRLKVVGRAGIGVDNIDVPAATKRGIIVMNTPRANAIATAELAIGLMLACVRHIVVSHQSLGDGDWQRSRFVGTELHGKTLGVVGFGNIGKLVAQRAQAFGMKVIAFDPAVTEVVALDLGVSLVDLDDLFKEADVITLHATLTPETERMINATSIAQMKDGVILVNGARGKLIDEADLAEALKSGRIRAAAVDVYSKEPPPAGHPLIGLPNVVHTPHLGASTEEAQHAVATEIVEQVLEALRGQAVRNAINMPFSMGPGFEQIEPYMALASKIGVLQRHLASSTIDRVEVSVRGELADRLIRPVAAAMLQGILSGMVDEPVNVISAPLLAEEVGLTMTQTQDAGTTDYPNLIYSRAYANGGDHVIAGVLFAGREPRIVQVDSYHLDANPKGIVLIMQNRDVPGVIGQVGTILAAHNVNIGEWRMGRFEPGSEALSFINLDSEPPPPVLAALTQVPAIIQVRLIRL